MIEELGKELSEKLDWSQEDQKDLLRRIQGVIDALNTLGEVTPVEEVKVELELEHTLNLMLVGRDDKFSFSFVEFYKD